MVRTMKIDLGPEEEWHRGSVKDDSSSGTGD